ncbi:hypothetical protein FE257_004936 [Aspergillus nanangensis]|uniref:Uncharacterized protein n=1 Tax=Aspergillus nanangensis TaxID=2582783 RepID=A0AAD4CAI3_ASPNN|nr:hypothetical protein FE257_004936 [Aspergillus nanangensis]
MKDLPGEQPVLFQNLLASQNPWLPKLTALSSKERQFPMWALIVKWTTHAHHQGGQRSKVLTGNYCRGSAEGKDIRGLEQRVLNVADERLNAEEKIHVCHAQTISDPKLEQALAATVEAVESSADSTNQLVSEPAPALHNQTFVESMAEYPNYTAACADPGTSQTSILTGDTTMDCTVRSWNNPCEGVEEIRDISEDISGNMDFSAGLVPCNMTLPDWSNDMGDISLHYSTDPQENLNGSIGSDDQHEAVSESQWQTTEERIYISAFTLTNSAFPDFDNHLNWEGIIPSDLPEAAYASFRGESEFFNLWQSSARTTSEETETGQAIGKTDIEGSFSSDYNQFHWAFPDTSQRILSVCDAMLAENPSPTAAPPNHEDFYLYGAELASNMPAWGQNEDSLLGDRSTSQYRDT